MGSFKTKRGTLILRKDDKTGSEFEKKIEASMKITCV